MMNSIYLIWFHSRNPIIQYGVDYRILLYFVLMFNILFFLNILSYVVVVFLISSPSKNKFCLLEGIEFFFFFYHKNIQPNIIYYIIWLLYTKCKGYKGFSDFYQTLVQTLVMCSLFAEHRKTFECFMLDKTVNHIMITRREGLHFLD